MSSRSAIDNLTGRLGVGGAFVGREHEMARLEAARAEAVAGSPRLLLVSGPPGIGKSTLIRMFAAGSPALTLRRAAGDESERTVAYGLVDQLIGPTSSPPAKDRHPDPLTVGSGLLTELASLTGPIGLMLVLDDVQWADRPSLDSLTFALRRLRRDPVVTVLACRTDALDRLPASLHRLVADEGTHIRLEGLGDDDLVALSAALGETPLSRLAARRLRRHTDGNPLHVVALLEQFERAQLEATPTGALPAPQSFANLVTARLAGCSPEARELVAAASVIGLRGPLALAMGVAGTVSPADVVDEAVGAGLITVPPSGGELCFPHRLIRLAVYEDLAPGRRSQLHARTADLAGVEEVALRHRIAACLGEDGALARRAAAYAGRSAAAGKWESAAEIFSAAGHLTPHRHERERWTLEALQCLLLVGDIADASAYASQVRGFEPSAHQNFALGRLAMFAGSSREATERLHMAWASCRQPEDRLVAARIAGDLAHLSVNHGRAAEAVTWARRASESAVPSDVPDATTLMCLGLGAMGRAREGLGSVPPVPPAFQDLGPAELDALVGRGVLELWTDDLAAARATLNRAEAGLGRRGPLHLRLIALFYLADAEYRMGLWAAAILHSQVAVSLARDADQEWTLALVHAVAAFPLAAMGQWDAADAHAREARLAARRLRADLLWSSVADARIAQARGDHHAMLAALVPVQELAVIDGRNEPGIQPWTAMLAEALLGVGRLDEADEILRSAETIAHARDHPTERVRVARLRGLLLMSQKRLPEAAEVLEEGRAQDPLCRAPFERALLDTARGGVLRRLGKRRAALAAFGEASDRLVALSAQPFLERCQREQASSGIPLGSGTAVAQRLTPQEHAVATLVATGMSNREAAEQLVVSVKTVEYHLGHIFGKLGVTSRGRMAVKLRSFSDRRRTT